MQTRFLPEFGGEGPSHSVLLAGGVMFYLVLVGALLYAIVALIHSDDQPQPFARPAQVQPVVFKVGPRQAVLDPCVAEVTADRNCFVVTRLIARAQLKKRSPASIASERGATGNLLWAPAGAVIAVAEPEALPADAAPGPAIWNVPADQGRRAASIIASR